MASPRALSAPPSPWRVIITEWALDSYLNLKHGQVFTDAEYWTTIRPDVALLKGGIPSTHPKFQAPTFWGPAKLGNVPISNGHKMKWRQVGAGLVQLRLPVTAGSHNGATSAFLCACYVKHDSKAEQRQLLKFKSHINLIALGGYVYRGEL